MILGVVAGEFEAGDLRDIGVPLRACKAIRYDLCTDSENRYNLPVVSPCERRCPGYLSVGNISF